MKQGHIEFTETADARFKNRVQESLERNGIIANFRDFGNKLVLTPRECPDCHITDVMVREPSEESGYGDDEYCVCEACGTTWRAE